MEKSVKRAMQDETTMMVMKKKKGHFSLQLLLLAD